MNRPKTYKNLLWDLDGTLTDPAVGITAAAVAIAAVAAVAAIAAGGQGQNQGQSQCKDKKSFFHHFLLLFVWVLLIRRSERMDRAVPMDCRIWTRMTSRITTTYMTTN